MKKLTAVMLVAAAGLMVQGAFAEGSKQPGKVLTSFTQVKQAAKCLEWKQEKAGGKCVKLVQHVLISYNVAANNGKCPSFTVNKDAKGITVQKLFAQAPGQMQCNFEFTFNVAALDMLSNTPVNLGEFDDDNNTLVIATRNSSTDMISLNPGSGKN